MGLTLVHGKSQPNTKPRIIVVAEESVHAALISDLELDVHPQCFDYDSFVKASLSKSISTNNTIIVVSDALSQRVAPLEAVIALVRKNVVLIPWKSTEDEIKELAVAVTSPRPTPNTLRRSIFQHSGMNDLPPRFDGDDYIQEPPNASVVDFVPNQEPVNPGLPSRSQFNSPIDWFSPKVPEAQAPQVEVPAPTPVVDETSENFQYLPEQEQEKIVEQNTVVEEPVAFSTNIARTDEPSFLPEFFQEAVTETPQETSDFSATEAVVETPASTSHSDINSFWSDSEVEEIDMSDIFTTPKPADTQQNVAKAVEAQSEPATQSPVARSDDFAFSAHDSNGAPQMWTMFDTNQAPAQQIGAENATDLPDGTDHRKAISLFEPLVVCVYSPKGGVGKTSISVNMAARLAYTTRLQVCIVDLDIAFGNVGTRLGLYNPTVRELLNEPHIDGESLARNLVYDKRSGLFALLAPLRPETGVNRRKFSPAAYKKILNLLTERFDVVILDCPVELRDPLVSGFALTEAEEVVMIVNNEQATLLDARRAVEAMCRPKDSQRLPGLGIDPHNVGLVVNQKVDNVGREVEDVRAILSGGDPNHPSREIDILSVIGDDRHLWVGNANMARTVATSGENEVDSLLDDIWAQLLPSEAANDFESQAYEPNYVNPMDEILGTDSKKKKKFNIFKGKS